MKLICITHPHSTRIHAVSANNKESENKKTVRKLKPCYQATKCCVLVYRYTEGITIVLLCLRTFVWLLNIVGSICIGSCEPVHEDRTQKSLGTLDLV